MSHATPTPIKINRQNDHTPYFTRSMVVRRVRHASAVETRAANEIIAQKWVSIIKSITTATGI